MRQVVAALAMLLTSSGLLAADRPLYIFGGDDHKTFLGCLNCSSTHPKSVWNEMSQFGFRNDFGVWNSYGQFINPYSAHSMCGEYARDPPIIVDDEGNAYGRMTINEFATGSVCGANGDERLCRAVRAICESKN
jgi:hypothetical protein